MAAMGFVADESTLGTPSEVYEAQGQKVCFIPRTIFIHVGARRGRSVGYLVAIKDTSNSGDWLFLDSAAFLAKPHLLRMLVPGLPEAVALPPNENQFDQ